MVLRILYVYYTITDAPYIAIILYTYLKQFSHKYVYALRKFSLILKHVPMVKHMSINHFNFFFLFVFDGLNENSLANMKKENKKRIQN